MIASHKYKFLLIKNTTNITIEDKGDKRRTEMTWPFKEKEKRKNVKRWQDININEF